MPRKNARPAAKKAAAKLRAKMNSNTKPEPPRVGFIAHHHPHRVSGMALAMMAAAMIEAPEPLEHHRHQEET